MSEEEINDILSHCKNLKILYIESDNIKEISNLPKSLEILTCRSCENLEEFSYLNEGLKGFNAPLS